MLQLSASTSSSLRCSSSSSSISAVYGELTDQLWTDGDAGQSGHLSSTAITALRPNKMCIPGDSGVV